MKKIILSALLAVALILNVFALASCGNGDSSSTNNGAGSPAGSGSALVDSLAEDEVYDGSAVTIKFYHTMGANLRTVLEKYIVEFNKLYPNITVEHSQEGGYDDVRDKISTELTVGDQPNIAYCYPDHVALYNLTGAVVPLDMFIANTATQTGADGHTETFGLTQEQIDDFIEAYYNEGKEFGDGKMYTMPLSKSTEVLYYNKTFFDANGLTPPKTWDELEVVCQQILAIDPTCIPLGYDSESNWFITMTEQLNTPYTSATGEEHFLFDTAENHAFMLEFTDWYTKGYITTQEIYGAYTSGLFVAQSGTKSYMSIGSSAGATHQRPTAQADGSYPFEVGITTVPQADPSNPKVISQGPSLCIFTGEKQEVLASWLFVKFLTTNVNFQAEFGMTSGYVPVIESVAQNEIYSNFLAQADGGDYIAALSAKVCLEQKDAYYTSPAFNGSSVARDQVGALVQKCFIDCQLAGDPEQFDAIIKQAFEDAVGQCKYLAG